jgi:hypothetical protein
MAVMQLKSSLGTDQESRTEVQLSGSAGQVSRAQAQPKHRPDKQSSSPAQVQAR